MSDAAQTGVQRIQAKLASSMKDLPPVPVVLNRIMEMTRQTDGSIEQLAKLISTDQALTAKLLRVANSASVAFAGEVFSVRQAVLILGFDHVRNLALGLSALAILQSRSPKVAEAQQKLWIQSVARSQAAGELCRRARLGGESAELLTVAALLSDVGRLFLLHALGDLYLTFAAQAEQNGTPLAEIEQRVLGVPHSQYGKDLATRWHFPAALALLIGGSQADIESAGAGPLARPILSLAAGMARAAFPTPVDGGAGARDFASMRELGLQEKEYEAMVDQVWNAVRELVRDISD